MARIEPNSHKSWTWSKKEVGKLNGTPIRLPTEDSYRTCSVCGRDCESDVAFGSNNAGGRIAFICPVHGIQSLVDPFEEQR
ncbi:hypothetical protein JOF28_000716 [Leucobacter exalbidus]|uniref:Uncharacterized protein n=1 Tax=Leucobacter exalbidus TaxID=662960 RepID=A0A940T396_9MICO|nr:hypothetical protein [Leucobacter exalbidus]